MDNQQRLGHLASDLGKISAFAESGSDEVVQEVLIQAKHLTEWAAIGLEDRQILEKLTSIKEYLIWMEQGRGSWTHNPISRQEISVACRQQSNDLIKLAGFLDEA